MLEVSPIQSKEEQAIICDRCGLPFDIDDMAYQATIDGVLAGICLFRMKADGGFIRGLALAKDTTLSDKDKTEALFVMGRATLNFIDLCGVHTAFFDDALFDDETTIKAIGFRRRDDGAWHMDLTDFFTSSPCRHCHD